MLGITCPFIYFCLTITCVVNSCPGLTYGCSMSLYHNIFPPHPPHTLREMGGVNVTSRRYLKQRECVCACSRECDSNNPRFGKMPNPGSYVTDVEVKSVRKSGRKYVRILLLSATIALSFMHVYLDASSPFYVCLCHFRNT